jgi:hypothetical protein
LLTFGSTSGLKEACVVACKEVHAMDQATAQFAIKILLTEIRRVTEDAASTAKAAEVCAQAGNIEQGVSIVLDVEQAAYEAGRLLDAASLINRLSKE